MPLCLLHALACHTLLEYNAFGQVTSEYQEHSGAVNTSTTLKVGYAYATGASNHVRRTQTVYPNGRILHSGYDQDADGDGTPDLAQTRTHNVVNEITAITGGSWATPAHDRAGNMTTIPSPRLQGGRGAGGEGTSLACTYDAWNRLVKVVDASTSNTVAEYVYDGRNFRIVTKTCASGVLSEVRHAYYSGDWQLLEERVEAAPLPNPQSLSPAAQFVWGLRYIDDLVLRDRSADSNTSTGNLGKTGSGLEERLYAMQDANWNVVAIADTSGAVQERYIYTAYGTPTFLDAAFVTRSASSFAWETLYTGRQYDSETGFLYYRERYLGSHLGRFLARDPVQHKPADGNLYAYCGENPPIRTDPNGEQFVPGTNNSPSPLRVPKPVPRQPTGLISLPVFAAMACSGACFGHLLELWDANGPALTAQGFGAHQAALINGNPNSGENIELRHCIAAAHLARAVGCGCASCLGWAREQWQHNHGENTLEQSKRGNCNNQQGLFAAGCGWNWLGSISGTPTSGLSDADIVGNCEKRRCEGKMTGQNKDCGTSMIE